MVYYDMTLILPQKYEKKKQVHLKFAFSMDPSILQMHKTWNQGAGEETNPSNWFWETGLSPALLTWAIVFVLYQLALTWHAQPSFFQTWANASEVLILMT